MGHQADQLVTHVSHGHLIDSYIELSSAHVPKGTKVIDYSCLLPFKNGKRQHFWGDWTGHSCSGVGYVAYYLAMWYSPFFSRMFEHVHFLPLYSRWNCLGHEEWLEWKFLRGNELLTIFLMFVKHTVPVFFFLMSHESRFSLFSASNKCVELGSACKFQPLFHRYPIWPFFFFLGKISGALDLVVHCWW